MEQGNLDPRLSLLQAADMEGRVVLVRVDHNVVKQGRIEDPYRIDSTFGTLYSIVEKGGRPVLMTHVGRPRDKKTGRIQCRESQSVTPIVRYLEQKLAVKIHVPDLPIDPEQGITGLDHGLQEALVALRERRIGMIYLPNTRWFQGEQATGPERGRFARELAGIADLYVNDAFGSWQPHASTYDVAQRLPAFAGVLMQRELRHLDRVLAADRPFLAVIAGAKYDTKIGPLKVLYRMVDHLILGGVIYNSYLAAKYDLQIAGVTDEDRALAQELVDMDAGKGKILELRHVVISDTLEGADASRARTLSLEELCGGGPAGHILGIDPRCFEQAEVQQTFASARTVFVNAVMGLMPAFAAGTRRLFEQVTACRQARKLLAGGDTLQELRRLCPGLYLAGLDAEDTYYFTGGGSVLAAIEQGGPYRMQTIQALLKEAA